MNPLQFPEAPTSAKLAEAELVTLIKGEMTDKAIHRVSTDYIRAKLRSYDSTTQFCAADFPECKTIHSILLRMESRTGEILFVGMGISKNSKAKPIRMYVVRKIKAATDNSRTRTAGNKYAPRKKKSLPPTPYAEWMLVYPDLFKVYPVTHNCVRKITRATHADFY